MKSAARFKEEQQHKNKQIPGYLKNVESRIKHEVNEARRQSNNSQRQHQESSNNEIQIYVKPKAKKTEP